MGDRLDAVIVFDWIRELHKCRDSAHLIPLHLCWSEYGRDYDFEVYKELAARIEKKGFYKDLLDIRAWRENLIASFCLTLTRNSDHFSELVSCYKQRSFVSPQIGVALVRLHKKEAREILFESLSWGDSRLLALL